MNAYQFCSKTKLIGAYVCFGIRPVLGLYYYKRPQSGPEEPQIVPVDPQSAPEGAQSAHNGPQSVSNGDTKEFPKAPKLPKRAEKCRKGPLSALQGQK